MKKVEGLMMNDKKFLKAAPLFCKLIESDCTKERCDEFFRILVALDDVYARRTPSQSQQTRVANTTTSTTTSSLAAKVDGNEDMSGSQSRRIPLSSANEDEKYGKTLRTYFNVFSSVRKVRDVFKEEQMFTIDTLILFHESASAFFTDDSFQFARAAKFTRDCIGQLQTMFPKKSELMHGKPWEKYIPTEEEKRKRMSALVCSLENMFANRKKQFTQADVDQSFKCASDLRLLFPQKERERIDDMYDVVKEMRSCGVLGAKRTANKKGLFRSYAN
eukprot:m.35332 g.35332  ORF g.35332 m.35332 type:complete len:275 (-) comp10010_c1_seq1:63-887(-)